MNKPLTQYLVLFLSVLFCVFTSCSDSTPLLDTVYFNCSIDTVSHNERMVVFVELESSVEDIHTMIIKNISSEKEWIVENPEIIHDKKNGKYFCGSSNLVPEKDETFPSGEYTILYRDRAGREIETTFFYIKNK